MKQVLCSAYQAKNSTLKRNARTPEQAVFGKSLMDVVDVERR